MRRSFLACLTALGVFVACTTTKEVHVPVFYDDKPDAAKPLPTGDDDDDEVPPKLDAGTDAKPGGLTPIRETNAVVTIGAKTKTLDHAQFGINKDGTWQIEGYEGGSLECPEQGSPTPKRTVLIANFEPGKAGDKRTKADGVAITLLDFAGDQLPQGQVNTTAKTLTVEIVAIKGETEIEVEVEATFPEGTVKGRYFATHCDSLNEP